jgi:hypothetical protein
MSAVRTELRISPVVFISKNYSLYISLRWISGRTGVAF